MSNGVQIELDKASLNHLEKQFNALNTTIKKASPKAITKVLTQIQAFAKERLKGRGHIVTSRLRNSIYVQSKHSDKIKGNNKTYEDDSGKTFNAELSTVKIKDEFEGAVGTNVEYASFIEHKDSYLYWAMKNIDMAKGLAEELRNEMKFKL